jgi:hypothetical protein
MIVIARLAGFVNPNPQSCQSDPKDSLGKDSFPKGPVGLERHPFGIILNHNQPGIFFAGTEQSECHKMSKKNKKKPLRTFIRNGSCLWD